MTSRLTRDRAWTSAPCSIQHPHDGRMEVRHGPHERRLPLGRLPGVDLRAGGQERPHAPPRSRPCAAHQHGFARCDRRGRGRAGRQQGSDHLRVRVLTGEGEWRDAVIVRDGDIRPGADQMTRRVEVVPIHGPMERRSAIRLGRVDVELVGDQCDHPRGVPRPCRIDQPQLANLSASYGWQASAGYRQRAHQGCPEAGGCHLTTRSVCSPFTTPSP